MDYPANFKQKVRAEFPDWEALHEALESGHEIVGDYLKDAEKFSSEWPPARIAETLNMGRIAEVVSAAEQAVRRRMLYKEWHGLQQQD